MARSIGTQGMVFGAKLAGVALAVSGPFGVSASATVGTFFVPGIATAAAKTAVVGALFSGSFILSFLSVPLVGGLFFLSMVTQNPNTAMQYQLAALVLGTGYLILSAAIGASALSAAGVNVTFAAAAISVLAGAGAIMLGAAVLAALVSTCFVAPCLEDLTHNGQAHGGPSFARQLWQ